MATPQSISSVFEGLEVSTPISRHEATQCFPALDRSTGEHYLIKTIRVPGTVTDNARPVGRLTDRASANKSYKEQARTIVEEAKYLRHLSTLGNFVDYDSIQILPAENRDGYDVCLLASHRTSFQNILCKPGLTQLEVVNMALDICSALSVCRQAGYFYANLKPSNIFYTGQHYRIGDLGFVSMSAIGRSPLPESYISRYTAPELRNGRTHINDTADLYALGIMLYEAYNGGTLPGKDDVVGQLLAPPKYADYELAEIILRACAPDPSVRWHDPQQMGQALSRYLKRNGIRNAPIIPPIHMPPEESSNVEPFLPDEDELISSPAQARSSHAVESAKKKHSRAAGFGLVAFLAVVLILEIIIGGVLFDLF